ncbi:NUDIX domain-containing protein [Pseudanabaena sp. FACHB-2040]|uniref:NUDIX domain-containing protein n=1 Tax=Pseudanabaena sp. FACHB-2040 TaxID=2692859 RepID=UPI0016899D5E|nr:NUDIX hydrolase [Pseudanabaena sp. FACHB-2040]
MKKKRMRAIAICLFRHQGRILVNEGFDSVKQETFFRPLGGGIDFCETSRDAIVREVREELGAEISEVQLLGVLESIFLYLGEPGHEIVFVYDARFVDASLYDQEQLAVQEGDRRFTATWKSLAEMTGPGRQLVPEGLAALL